MILNTFTLGGITFSSADSVKQKVLLIINTIKTTYKEITNAADKAFLIELFSKHENAEAKLGNLKNPRVFYGKNTKYKGKTNCFYIEHCNGKRIDISYLKCIAKLKDEITNSKNLLLQQHFNEVGTQLADFVVNVLQTFLLSQSQVVKALNDRFPYKKAKTEQQYLYFKLMTEIADKYELIEEQLINTCIEKFIQIDADIEIGKHTVIISDIDLLTEQIIVPSLY